MLAACIALLLAAVSAAHAAGTIASAAEVWDSHVARAHPTVGTIEVDGDLTEPDWGDATPLDGFVQLEPDEGMPGTQATEVRILYDARYLYFGFTCHESEMDRIVANEMRRDARLHENDNVYILLDTYNDKRSGFFFRLNPLGTRQDIAATDNGDSRNENWNIVWEAETTLHDDRWTAEIAIPFSQLRFKRGGDMVWGMNVGRGIRRNQEEASWIPLRAHDRKVARWDAHELVVDLDAGGICRDVERPRAVWPEAPCQLGAEDKWDAVAFLQPDSSAVEEQQRWRTAEARPGNAEVKEACALEEEGPLLREEQAEPREVHLFLVCFDLREVGVVRDVGGNVRRHAVFRVEADLEGAGLVLTFRLRDAGERVREYLDVRPRGNAL